MQDLEITSSSTGDEGLVASGATLQRMQTQFSTAVAIQRPRRRFDDIRACEEEAVIAGDDFFYSWTVNSQEGKKLVEGLSVQAALAAARNWGNCGIPCSVEENANTYIFTATFVDLETGFNLQRAFRQKKTLNIGKKYNERAEDIVFQIGQSKAIRNVILNALPSWLTSRMLAKAKENVIEKINKMGIAVAREKTVGFFAKYGVTADRVENKLGGKKVTAWDAEDLALLQGAMNAIMSGQESADSMFPVYQETGSKAEDVKSRFADVKPEPEAKPAEPEKKMTAPDNPFEAAPERNFKFELESAGSEDELYAIWKDFEATKPAGPQKVEMLKIMNMKQVEFKKKG